MPRKYLKETHTLNDEEGTVITIRYHPWTGGVPKGYEIKPLACDNPRSPHGFEDKSIERKAKKLATEIAKGNPGCECFVEHYEYK